ncbi:CRISPR-associated helicase Cas3' [Picrophilus oshimae]|nr:CRISPR-associated helicase Cas3' [Picrophilus oshimae]
MNFYSHKWCEDGNIKFRFLHDHLIEVGRNSYKSIKCIYLNKNDEYLKKSAFIVGCLHDFGKYTEFFQDYLLYNKKQKYKSHAFISALYAAYCAKQNNFPDEYVLYIYLAVKHHHGNLCNLDSDIGIPQLQQNISYDIEVLKKQCDNIKKNIHEIEKDFKCVADFSFKETGIKLDYIDSFISHHEDIFNYLVKIYKNIKYTSNSYINIEFTDFLLIYSALIDNDKRNAASLDVNDRKYNIKEELIENYKKSRFTTKYKINNMRDELYKTVKHNMQNADLSNHFYTITSPTGSGKTLAGIAAALILRDKLKDSVKKLYRIIYALPFTTIVDQNYEVMRSVLSGLKDFEENDERYIIKHHHLSLSTQKIAGEELPVDQSLMLTEDWDSEIIFTTFVQLFESLAGFKNRNLKKYFRIANSIIILDEIQSISIENWENIKFLLKLYAEKFDIYFIIMTATQPNIIDDAVELSGDYKSMFRQLSRVEMHINLEPMTPEEVIDKYINCKYSSILFMFNTIKASIDAYNHLKTLTKKKVYYISTNIIPKHRMDVINKIKDSIKNKEDIIVVSTQIFEAGIDISFDIVIRDIAPIDCLIQSSGRVNRNGNNNKKGEIYIVNCSPKNSCNGYFSRHVYGQLHTDISLGLLKNRVTIDESDYLDIIKEYYKCVRQLTLQSSENLERALNNLNFFKKNKSEINDEYYVSNFHIINDFDKYINIFVEIDDEAADIINKYKVKKYNYYDDDIIKFRKEMYNYIISVRKTDLKNIVCDKFYDDFYIIRKNYLESSYDNTTGLKINNGESLVI